MKKNHSTAHPAGEPAGRDEAVIQPTANPLDGQADIDTGGKAAGQSETAADPCQELIDSIATKDKDFATLSDKYLRIAAEYDNFRRRSQKEKDVLYTESVSMVVREFLPILDNLDRAELAAGQFEHEDARKIAEGIAMIQKSVAQVLSRLGVSRIECCGLPFDPEMHEAVMHVEDDSVGASIVVEELQKGYKRDDRVIRHSIVKVAN
jgi:molecular chaperone GrpE